MVQGLSLLLSQVATVAQPFGPPGVPSIAFPPLCSIAPQVAEQAPRSTVLNFTDGTHPRCASVVVPSGMDGPLPILFDFHGAGGNAENFGGRRDRLGVSLLHRMQRLLLLASSLANRLGSFWR